MPKLASIVLLSTFAFVANIACAATPFQTSVGLSFVQSKFSQSDFSGTSKSDAKGINVSYYLRTINSDEGPLLERPFVTKSAYISGSFVDGGSDGADSITLNPRFVTLDDLIIEVGLVKIEDFKTYTVGFGRYLDNRTTVVATIGTSSPGSTNTISIDYKRLMDLSAPGTYLSFNGGLGYSSNDAADSYSGNVGANYFLSDQLSFGGSALLSKSEFSDATNLSARVTYFFTEMLNATLSYSKTNNTFDDFGGKTEFDTDLISVNASARF